ncbi:right-handed parallel beta-helix repeat-containing protein [uncultured Sphingomonas sp.]|uniref:right-handed parallel beta-helix repeat-containing protein n=1 Tax=uncultured Sphingomonas sp. TaxID=158754 RepID=UPI0026099650|nr:right-handed parallel beta-helix repeat-containing protein [uncultured Sphingomonas sp.]
MRLMLPLALILVAGPAVAQAGGAPFTVGNRGFATLQEAVGAIGDGEGTIRIAPGTYRECAVQEAGRISYVAAVPGKTVFTRVTCEDKAALVLRGRGARVEGIVFSHLEVADGNGAGIRIEKGPLTVENAMFLDSQSGILSADDPAAAITIDHSTFAGLGKDPTGNGAHGIYIGDYGTLTVTASRFERGTGGHYLKSRAKRVMVTDSSFDDTRGQATNYMIDLSNGAQGRIAGNTFVVGRNKDNHSTLITVAPEGAKNDSTGLVIENNVATLAPGVTYRPVLVGNWSGETLALRGNRLGAGISLTARRW